MKRALPKPLSRGVAARMVLQPVDGAVGRVVLAGLTHADEDLDELVVGVVGELDRPREARAQPGLDAMKVAISSV